MVKRRVAVIGAGVGGLAVAGYAGLSGWQVHLYDVRPEAIAPVRAAGGIEMTGKLTGLAPVALATLDPAAAVAGAELVVMVVTGPDQGAAARAVAPHLVDGQVLLVKPGCTGGALEVAGLVAGRGVLVAESDAFLFGCSVPAPGASHVGSLKQSFVVAAVPAARTPAALAVIGALFPQAVAAQSVLHTGLSNMNAVVHAAPMLANAGWIEHAKGAFQYYGDGITPTVARTVAAYDAERLAVAAALGVQVPSLLEWIAATYGIVSPDPYEAIQRLQREVYKNIPAPVGLQHRFLTEDVPCGTVPVAELGEALGVPVPLHRALVHLASVVLGTDFWTEGRTVAKLGLAGLDAAAIRQMVL